MKKPVPEELFRVFLFLHDIALEDSSYIPALNEVMDLIEIYWEI